MLPYLVTCTEDSVSLLELEDGRFRMLEQGPVARFASGYRYLLLDRALARYLKSLKVPGITLAPAVIFNATTGEEHRSHMRVFGAKPIHVDEITSLDLDGLHLLAMNGEHYFVSPSLRFALEANEFEFLEFSQGLSAFASAA